MSTKITSPIEGYAGRTVFGPLSVEFTDGVAETDEKLSDGLKAYLKERGYKVGSGRPAKPAEKPDDGGGKRPQKNDSTEAWREYAATQGMTAEKVADMGRDDIIKALDNPGGGDGS